MQRSVVSFVLEYKWFSWAMRCYRDAFYRYKWVINLRYIFYLLYLLVQEIFFCVSDARHKLAAGWIIIFYFVSSSYVYNIRKSPIYFIQIDEAYFLLSFKFVVAMQVIGFDLIAGISHPVYLFLSWAS